MKLCSRYLLKWLFFWGIFYGLSTLQCLGQEKLDGKVIFSSLDRRDIIFPGLEIFIEGKDLKRRYSLGVEALSVDLPPGTYQITATCNHFYPFRRSPLQVKPGETVRINLLPALRVLSIASGISEKGAFDDYQYAPQVRYASFLSNVALALTPQLLIRFDQRTSQKDYVEYTAKLENTLMASYDTLSIFADKIRFNEKSVVLEAEGNVVFEDGKKTHTLLFSSHSICQRTSCNHS
jgi:hypothetical protein